MKHRVAPAARPARPARLSKRIGTLAAVGVGLVTTVCALACATAAQADDTVRAMPVSEFLDTLAVNTHVNYTDGAYANVHNVADDLAWLGIHYVRDAAPGNMPPFDSYIYLAQRGVKFDFGVGSNFADSLGQAARLNATVPGSVVAIEGFNEIDNQPVTYHGLKGTPAGLAAQRDIYARVRSTPALANVPVYDLTGYDLKLADTRADAADYVNQHFYPQNGEQPAYNGNGDRWMGNAINAVKKFQRPYVVTEFGYFSLPQAGWYFLGVDERTQAKGVLNGYMDTAAAGITRTYVYELLDEKPDPQNKDVGMHFGMFRNDNSPKPVAYAIRNLTTILNAGATRGRHGATGAHDTAASAAPACALANMPVSANSLLLQKRDGSYVLALWNETPIWDRAKGTPVTEPPAHVEVDFGAAASRVDLYDPLDSASPFESHRNIRRLDVSVPDHPVLIEVKFAHPQPA